MSTENVKQFLELVKTDEGLARKVIELKDSLQDGSRLTDENEILAEKVLPLAKAHGLEFTVEEFLAYANSVSGELSDDDLLNVSGGISARGVALGLLFATGLSFVPSILSSFAEGPGGSVPSAPETSISQSYDTELEEDSSMELEERKSEKEVRSSREDVRRASGQVRAAQKRVDVLESKLKKDAGVDNVNNLTNKQKKKFPKLINQIELAKEDLSAAQQKLEASKEQTDTAEKVKTDVKEKNASIIKERLERKETENNRKQFAGVMKELLESEEKKEEKKEEVIEEEKKGEVVEKEQRIDQISDEDAEKIEGILESLKEKGIIGSNIEIDFENNDLKVILTEIEVALEENVDLILDADKKYDEDGYKDFLTADERQMLNNLKSTESLINTVEDLEQKSQQLIALNYALDGRVETAEAAINEIAQRQNDINEEVERIAHEKAAEEEERFRKVEEERITREKQAEEWRRKVNLSKKRAQKNKMTSRSAVAKYAEDIDIELEALSAKVIEKINERLAVYNGEDDEPYRLTLTARKGEISIGKTINGEVITVEDLKKDLEELGFDELKEARIKQIDNLLTVYGNTMSAQNKTLLETQKKNISEDKMKKQALTGLENTLKSIEANLQKEAEVKEKKGALNGMLGHLYNTQAKSELQDRLNEVDVDNVTIHNGQELIDSLNEIEKKIVEAEQQQKDKIKDLSKELNEINDTIDGMYYERKDTDALSQKYKTLNTKMNSGEFDLTQVENEIKELKELVEQVDKGTIDLKQVEFAGDARSWDGTIENLYNCLKAADFDIHRIENLDDWQESCEKALKAMTVYNDTLQIYQWTGTSCGSNVTDYKHKAMLKTLALFAMEGYKQEGSAKQVADPSMATADDVKIDDNLKEFVEGKK